MKLSTQQNEVHAQKGYCDIDQFVKIFAEKSTEYSLCRGRVWVQFLEGEAGLRPAWATVLSFSQAISRLYYTQVSGSMKKSDRATEEVSWGAVASVEVYLLYALGSFFLSTVGALLTPRAYAGVVVLSSPVIVLVGCCLVVRFLAYREGWKELGLRGRLSSASVGVLGYAASLPLLVALALLVEKVAPGVFYNKDTIHPIVRIMNLGRGWKVLAIAVAVLVAPVEEEIFFRGFVYAGLRRSLGVGAGTGASAFLFALPHIGGNVVVVFTLGLLFALLYEKTSSLLAPISAHILHNSIVVLLILEFGGTV